MGAQPELETHLKYCFQSSKGLVQVRVPLFWFGPLGLGSGFVRERVPVQVRLRTQTPRGGGFARVEPRPAHWSEAARPTPCLTAGGGPPGGGISVTALSALPRSDIRALASGHPTWKSRAPVAVLQQTSKRSAPDYWPVARLMFTIRPCVPEGCCVRLWPAVPSPC